MGKYLNLRDFSEYKPSAWALIAANMAPLFGVIFFGWDAFAIIALYWVENVIIGAINVLKIITCNPDLGEIEKGWAHFGYPVEAKEIREALQAAGSNAGNPNLLHHASNTLSNKKQRAFCAVPCAFPGAALYPELHPF